MATQVARQLMPSVIHAPGDIGWTLSWQAQRRSQGTLTNGGIPVEIELGILVEISILIKYINMDPTNQKSTQLLSLGYRILWPDTDLIY